MQLFVGLDIGSTTTKAVLLNASARIVSYCIVPSGADLSKAGRDAINRSLRMAGAGEEDMSFIIVTGYGREVFQQANRRATEILCHAKGAYAIFPETQTVIDIGGQDSKAIFLGNGGNVQRFTMNSKCAAGTGRFLEVMAKALDVDLAIMGEYYNQSEQLLSISSTCTVFAESEVISLLAQGYHVKDIVAGVVRSVARKVKSLLGHGISGKVVLTGGVAKNDGVRLALSDELGQDLLVPPEPQITGALGAAFLALEYQQKIIDKPGKS